MNDNTGSGSEENISDLIGSGSEENIPDVRPDPDPQPCKKVFIEKLLKQSPIFPKLNRSIYFLFRNRVPAVFNAGWLQGLQTTCLVSCLLYTVRCLVGCTVYTFRFLVGCTVYTSVADPVHFCPVFPVLKYGSGSRWPKKDWIRIRILHKYIFDLKQNKYVLWHFLTNLNILWHLKSRMKIYLDETIFEKLYITRKFELQGSYCG